MTLFYKIETGNTFEGAVVSQSLNSWLQLSGIFSKIYSSFGIKEAAKWQFYKNTHFPSAIASSIAALALSPWPYPKDLIVNFEFMLNFWAKFSTSILGSAPVDKTKIKGLWFVESL